MRKPVTPPRVQGTGPATTPGSSSVAGRVSAANSNTRVFVGADFRQRPAVPAPAWSKSQPAVQPVSSGIPTSGDAGNNLGLNSERLRLAMVQRLVAQGITDERVLRAMQTVPRHVFVDQGLASRAYEDAALPIGYSQTISQPWVVARMVSVVCENRKPGRVLEVGAGCGYQAAVLAQVVSQVYAIERIRGLYELAHANLRAMKLSGRVRLSHGDGMLGLPGSAPFDAIVVAAAGLAIPQALLDQLAVGGRLIAPEGTTTQRLVLIERTGASGWNREYLDFVRFVPLRPGIQ
jgi:protein-L-isoaspartate(D-aspartate) O-methyltransferase